jgi:hypothetical protein
MLSITADIALIATPIVIAIGFYFAYKQWVSIRKARMADIVISLTNTWDSTLMAESRHAVSLSGESLKKDYQKAIENSEKEAFGSLTRVGDFFDALGVLVAEGFLECKIAYDLFGEAEKYYHNIYESVITDTDYKDYVPYFSRLDELFTQEKSCRSTVKKKSAS